MKGNFEVLYAASPANKDKLDLNSLSFDDIYACLEQNKDMNRSTLVTTIMLEKFRTGFVKPPESAFNEQDAKQGMDQYGVFKDLAKYAKHYCFANADMQAFDGNHNEKAEQMRQEALNGMRMTFEKYGLFTTHMSPAQQADTNPIQNSVSKNTQKLIS